MTHKPTHFPSFYAECAWTDGYCDARDGTASAGSYIKHGEPDAVAMAWYRMGREAFLALQ